MSINDYDSGSDGKNIARRPLPGTRPPEFTPKDKSEFNKPLREIINQFFSESEPKRINISNSIFNSMVYNGIGLREQIESFLTKLFNLFGNYEIALNCDKDGFESRNTKIWTIDGFMKFFRNFFPQSMSKPGFKMILENQDIFFECLNNFFNEYNSYKILSIKECVNNQITNKKLFLLPLDGFNEDGFYSIISNLINLLCDFNDGIITSEKYIESLYKTIYGENFDPSTYNSMIKYINKTKIRIVNSKLS